MSEAGFIRSPRRPHASYRCERCGHKWGQIQSRASCPACGSLYVVWENYEVWRAAAVYPVPASKALPVPPGLRVPPVRKVLPAPVFRALPAPPALPDPRDRPALPVPPAFRGLLEQLVPKARMALPVLPAGYQLPRVPSSGFLDTLVSQDISTRATS